MHLLDTNACIGVLNGSSPTLVSRMEQYDPAEICLCSVVRAELLYGARQSTRVHDNLTVLQQFFEPFTSLPFDDACAEHYGLIRADLAREGRPIGRLRPINLRECAPCRGCPRSR